MIAEKIAKYRIRTGELNRIKREKECQQQLIKLVETWVMFGPELAEDLTTRSDGRNIKVISNIMSILYEQRFTKEFYRIAKTLDWTRPNVSLIVELALLGKFKNHYYRQAKVIAMFMDLTLSNSSDYPAYSKLNSHHRSSCVKDAMRIVEQRFKDMGSEDRKGD